MTTQKPADVGHVTQTAPLPAVPGGRRPPGQWRRIAGGLRHPLTAVCAVQATLSLTLVWSNTAFGDEADYLWIGQLILRHWLHGVPGPADIADQLSGSPLIYPPMGALASNIAGLAGARILSLLFMIGATVLLYFSGSKLVGRTGAVFAAALWALSEPALRLAFATYDPLSVALTAASAWLAVQAGFRRRGMGLVIASAIALALANATAYSGLVIDPVVAAFAFLSWLPLMSARQALLRTGLLAGMTASIFGIVLTATHSAEGTRAIFHRVSHDRQSLSLVLSDTWKFSGLIMVLAVVGVSIALLAERGPRAVLVAFLGCTVFVVPIAQLRFHTAWSLDKHLAYGTWFASIAAGYGCHKSVQWLSHARQRLAVACCVVALAYPAVDGWRMAWDQFHSWPNASAFVSSFEPVVAQSHGLIFAGGAKHIAAYYAPSVTDWNRWSASGMSLDPVGLPPSAWPSYYARTLASRTYSVVALFYNTTFVSASALPESILLTPRGSRTYQSLLSLIGQNSGALGLSALTLDLEKDPAYQLVGVGPYDTSNLSGTHDYGAFAIWKRVS